MACLSEGPRAVADAVALGPTGWPSVWCGLGSFEQPHPVPTPRSGRVHCTSTCRGQTAALAACPAVTKAGSLHSPGRAARHGPPSSSVTSTEPARFGPEAFPYTGETGLACVRMKEWTQDPSPPASLPGQGSPVFPRAWGEGRAA